jgi:acyl carrier protein
MDIEAIVEEILNDHLGAKASDEMEANIFERFGADGLDGIEIIMEIEEQLFIEMPDKDYATGKDYLDEAMNQVSGNA